MTRKQFRSFVVSTRQQAPKKLIHLLINARTYYGCSPYPWDFKKVMVMIRAKSILFDNSGLHFFIQAFGESFDAPSKYYKDLRHYDCINSFFKNENELPF